MIGGQGHRRGRAAAAALCGVAWTAGLLACQRGAADAPLPIAQAQTGKPEVKRSKDMPDGGNKTAAAAAHGRPAYLDRWPGLSVRQGDRVVEAPAEDVTLARGYPDWTEKGALVEGRRLSIGTARRSVAVGEEVRVVHVAEVAVEGRTVYVMGPKAIVGESVDGQLATPPAPASSDGKTDPLEPRDYDGKTLASPAVDYGYDITRYRFDAPGTHRIRWVLGALQSNELVIEVTARGR